MQVQTFSPPHINIRTNIPTDVIRIYIRQNPFPRNYRQDVKSSQKLLGQKECCIIAGNISPSLCNTYLSLREPECLSFRLIINS